MHSLLFPSTATRVADGQPEGEAGRVEGREEEPQGGAGGKEEEEDGGREEEGPLQAQGDDREAGHQGVYKADADKSHHITYVQITFVQLI